MPRVGAAAAVLDPEELFAPVAKFKRVGLAVSGGPDSLALMLLAHRFADPRGDMDRFVVYTVDHGLRAEGAAEAAFVVREAERLGFRARALLWSGSKPATGIQAAARLARYRLLSEAMEADGAEILLTAHHLADQAETVLMRLAHGSGLEGLGGMDELSDLGTLRIMRPLLRVDPSELLRVVEAAGIEAVRDPSNSDPGYERVRWRQMLPQLAALGLDARRLALFADRAREADRALDAAATRAFGESLGGLKATDPIEIDRKRFLAAPRAVAIRVVQKALALVGGNQKPYALAAVEALTDRLAMGRTKTTLHGCIVRSDQQTIRIQKEPGRVAPASRQPKEPTFS